MKKSYSRKPHFQRSDSYNSRYKRPVEQQNVSHASHSSAAEDVSRNDDLDVQPSTSRRNLRDAQGFTSAGNSQHSSFHRHGRNTDHKHYQNSHTHEHQRDRKLKENSSQYIHSSNQNQDYGRKDASSDRLEMPSSKTENNFAAGSVINGRYVRKSVSQPMTSQLNADAPPFIPKAVKFSGKSENSNHDSAKQKHDYRKYSNKNYTRAPFRNDVDYHDRSLHVNSTFHHGYSRPKFPKNSGRRNSQIDKDLVGNELSVEELVCEEWGADEREAILGDKAIFKSKESTTQRDRLISQLEKGECECLVCCEHMRTRDYIWSCSNCYHVFHLRCIKKWARSPTAAVGDSGWRCPACQNTNDQVPFHYYCFCGKTKDPEVNYHLIPHSCGEVCGKDRDDDQCVHRCNILCHPGPCPPCTATVNRTCACGKLRKIVPCAKSEIITCSSVCEKLLNCGAHTCKDICHTGACKPCAVTLKQTCFCRQHEREMPCGSVKEDSGYSCGETCGKKLLCGNHFCLVTCHSGPCGTCSLLPDVVTSCPCGKTTLWELQSSGKAAVRLSCMDPIPLCDNKCEKSLTCGPNDNHHKCNSNCHTGDCPPCSLSTMVKCRCGSTSKEVPCVDIPNLDFHCAKRCNRRKDCGRHKCLNNCCINLVHKCELVCNKKLSCSLHHCQETCHAGNCHTCWNVSFDELRCHCGHSVLYPPIPCGTKPPECNKPCVRSHSCDHTVQHTCHSEDKCPPCTVLTVKLCFSHQERRSNVQCFLDGVSCGKPCGKPLPCGQHKCQEICHEGNCLKPEATCSQPCVKLRPCGHPCSAPCHSGECPDSPCKAKMEVSCPCGLRREVATCSEDTNLYRLVSVSFLASKMQDIKAGESVNISDIFGKKGKSNRLQCNEECAIAERNKRLALALQIQNPDLSCKPGPPNYSEFLKDEAKKNFRFVSNVYDKFCDLVQLAKQSKQKSRSYAFPPMKRDQRRVIHELAEFFGCETQSYDEEPVKNVVITAFRDKSWLPFVSIMTVIERDMGLRRGPAPVVTSKVTPQINATEKKEKVIDYFDYTG